MIARPPMPDPRFDRVAPLYARVRPGYPEELYRSLLEEHGGARFAAAIDLGCGTGQSIEGLLAIADDVIGVEPADPMRREAEARFPNARFVRAGAQATGLPDASAELVTIATAFHWMHATRVLAECARLLAHGGLLAIYWYDVPSVEGPAQAEVELRMDRDWDAFRSTRLKRLARIAPRVARARGFERFRERSIPQGLRWEPARFVDFVRSTSYASAFLATRSPEEAQRYAADFEADLRAKGGDELVARFDLTLVTAVRSA